MSETAPAPNVAVLIPCLNEEAAIGTVVADFKAALPNATVFVYDNNSEDNTIQVAKEAGAVVRTERRPGKGNVVRRMFSDVEADVYIMVDGDDTYDAVKAPEMVACLVQENLDMVVGKRIETSTEAYRPGHRLGNRLLTGSVRWAFGKQFEDMLSGYRAFSRRFVKSFPMTSTEFEIETELTVHCLQMRMPAVEIATNYKDRPANSESKLRTFRDGWRILLMIGNLLRNERPLLLLGTVSLLLGLVAVLLAVFPLVDYFQDQPVDVVRLLCGLSLGLAALLLLVTGLILDLISHQRREQKYLAYLGYSSDVN